MKFSIIPPVHQREFFDNPEDNFRSWFENYAQNQEDKSKVFEEASLFWAKNEPDHADKSQSTRSKHKRGSGRKGR
jgi:hypothetical protein